MQQVSFEQQDLLNCFGQQTKNKEMPESSNCASQSILLK
jgi:hypothetical protein